MRAVLSSVIPVDRVAVFAEMAWMERRPELGVICRAARKTGNRISAAAVQSVLPGIGDAGARNIISWCRTLGICDSQGSLTSLGEDVAERDEAPVPEQGVYGFWLAEHPLIGRRILAAERRSSNRDHRFDDVALLPTEPDRGVIFCSVVDPQQRYLLRDLPSNHGQVGCLPGTTRATCRLRWTLDFDAQKDHWQLDGVIEVPQGSMKPMQHTPESDGVDLNGLANLWGTGPLVSFGRWQVAERRLAVAFRGITDAEQDDFRKTLKLPHVEVPGKGAYSDVILEDVPIGPVSADEAQRWAVSRLDRHLTRNIAYRSRSEVRRLFAELMEETPLEKFKPALPAHNTMISEQLAAKKPELFWSLAAPVDLAPHPIPPADLDAFRIEDPGVESVAEEPRVIRVPYRGGWSMRQIVDRLLAAGMPRRVLLCDRYVRGADNLASLKLFVQAVRQFNPSAMIDVWSDDEGADFKQIRALTGSAPRAYREVFGRTAPHDRYLLVAPDSNEGFGWQMSNSPLDARADVAKAGPETPLRSRGFVAVRMSAEELPERLRQWLSGGVR